MQSIHTASYQIHFDGHAYEALKIHLEENTYSRVFLLVDEHTRADCLPVFLDAIPELAAVEILQIASGEANKNIRTCEQLWQALSDRDADRKSLLINLGGGVLTDLGGFVASTFKRGIAFVNVPTTLLAMVDASIGGKTGVDLGALKNQVGVINQPAIVLVIPGFLKTLDQRQLISGFAEMLKHGLIRNRQYWETLGNLDSLEGIAPYIFESVHIKNEVVLKDPREDHLRKILNFGHTLGHAIESYFLESHTHKTLLHGEAIAIGMILEAYLSNKCCGLSMESTDRVKATFLKWFPKQSFTSEDITNILSLLRYDKKNVHGQINFALLSDIGEPAIDVNVPSELFAKAFAYYAD
jgi:3-dehydroquinate synthase